MEFLSKYQNLHFNRRIPAIPPVLVTLVGAGAAFVVMWLTIPTTALFWLLLPIVLVLVWLARFGWRAGLATLIAFLRRLETR